MRYHLDTIPVWDAYKEKAPCPLCRLMDRAEKSYVDNFLGGSVMEPDVRIEVNQKGFCRHHFGLLYAQRNRLGVALMAHTHLGETLKDLDKRLDGALGAVRRGVGLFDSGVLAKANKNGALPQALNRLKEATADPGKTCIICERLEETLGRYVYTLMCMYENESDFRKAFAESSGFCLPHFAIVLDRAPQHLHGRRLEDFLTTLITIEKAHLHRLSDELYGYTQQFDYVNAGKDFSASRDAVPRTLNALRGGVLGES
nr:DUF6062 family protein [bacterium]